MKDGIFCRIELDAGYHARALAPDIVVSVFWSLGPPYKRRKAPWRKKSPKGFLPVEV
jgi:hypothetical protein